MVVDIILCFNIFLNFFKKTRINFTLKAIALDYVTGSFAYDLITVIPGLLMINNREWLKAYPIKILRNIHVTRLFEPLELVLSLVLTRYSRKR